MAQAQGFDKSLNFAESADGASDRRIVGNLVETDIESDLVLFANNLRDFSEVPSDAYSVEPDGLVIITQNGYLPFSDGTQVIVVTYPDETSQENEVGGELSTELEVFESNALDRFRVKDSNGNAVTSGFDGSLQSLRRKDVVLFGNLTNLKATRIPSVDPSVQGGASVEEGDFSLFDTFDIAGVYDALDSSIASLQFAKTSIPRTYEESIFNSKNLVFEGSLRILNTLNVDVAANPTTAPGLYIQAGSTSKRAFSDTSNPWEGGTDSDVGAALITQADESTIGNMILYGSTPAIYGTWGAAPSTSDTGAITNWTHKIPLKINNGGSTVYLLVKT
jgi:hypothetical protein